MAGGRICGTILREEKMCDKLRSTAKIFHGQSSQQFAVNRYDNVAALNAKSQSTVTVVNGKSLRDYVVVRDMQAGNCLI